MKMKRNEVAAEEKTKKHNAFLVAASTDLYEACVAARALGTLGQTHSHAEVRDMLDRAIEKATGEKNDAAK